MAVEDIDFVAIRRFQEVWGPVMELLPALLDIKAHKDDLDRELTKSRAKASQAVAEIQAAYDEADKRIAAANKERDEIQAAKRQATADIDKAATDARLAIAAQKVAGDAAVVQANANVANIQAKASRLDKEYTDKKAALEADLQERALELTAVVSDLEARQAAAEKALGELRNKLV